LLKRPPTAAGVEGEPLWRYFEVVEAAKDLGERLS